MVPNSLDPGALVVFAVIAGPLTLFVTERVPVDVTAIGTMVALIVPCIATAITDSGASARIRQ